MTYIYEAMEFNQEKHVTYITFNRPEKMNPIGVALVNDLDHALTEIETNSNTKAVIITGSGKAFSAGGDLNTRHKTPSDGKLFTRKIGNIVKRMQKLEVPIITAVNGYCMGGGWNLIMGTDIIIASSSAIFSQPFANFGLVPDSGGTYFLPRTVGLLRAKELIFSQRRLHAEEALELGLVTEVVEPEKLMDRAQEWAEIFVNSSQTSTGLVKLMLNQSLKEDLDTMLEYETYAQIFARESDEHKDAVRAFIRKHRSKPS